MGVLKLISGGSGVSKGPRPDGADEESARLQARFDALGEVYAAVHLSPDGRFLEANDRFYQALGYRPEELIGRHHRTLVDPKDAASPSYEAFWQQLRAGKPVSREFKRVRKDGRPIYLRAAYCPVKSPNGEVERIIKFALDVTAEREASQRGQGVIELTMDGHVITANEQFLQMVGYTLEELRGKHHRNLVKPTEANSPAYAEFWRRLGAGEHVAATFERVAKDGSTVHMRAAYNPIFDHTGTAYKVVKYATNVTALKATATALEEMMGALGTSANTLATSTETMTDSAHATTERAEGLEHRANDISQSLQTVSAATEELSATVMEVARNAGEAAAQAEVGRTATNQASNFVAELRRVGETIESMVGLIEDIADQTKLLALNATIEAASAGAAGRGFKVVADEVKALSDQTTIATAKISAQVEGILRISRNTADAVESLGTIISSMAERQLAVAASAEQQQVATAEIASNAARVADAMSATSADASLLAKAADEVSRVATDSSSAVGALQGVVGRLGGLVQSIVRET